MTIEEFETVGNAVKAFASENATVVVGTVIDPEMHDELRVTVVATGIGAERKPDITLVKNNMVQERPARQPLISEALQSRVMEEARPRWSTPSRKLVANRIISIFLRSCASKPTKPPMTLVCLLLKECAKMARQRPSGQEFELLSGYAHD